MGLIGRSGRSYCRVPSMDGLEGSYYEIIHVLLRKMEEIYPDQYVTTADEDIEKLTKLLPAILDDQIIETYLNHDLGKGILLGLLTAYYNFQCAAEATDEKFPLD